MSIALQEEEYGADQIQALEGLDPVRKRPGMYVGSTGKFGLHHLAWELIDNSVDEAMGGYADRIGITLNENHSLTVSDNGRGIPIESQKHGSYKGMPTVEMVLTVLHAGGKFEGKAYAFSGGLHGVGSSVVNALSRWMHVDVRREGKNHHIEFGAIELPDGRIKSGATILSLKSSGKIPLSDTGTTVTFLPDDRVFSTTTWDFDYIARRVRQGAFLNAGLTFQLADNRDPANPVEVIYEYPNGLIDFMSELTEERLIASDKTPEDLLHPDPIVLGGTNSETQGEWDLVMRWHPDYTYRVHAFANGIETQHGGTHVKGFEQVLTSQINKYARQDHINLLGDKDPNLEALDVRAGLGVIVSVKVKEPQFVGQTKDELSNDETRVMVRQGFNQQFWDWMQEHPTEAKNIIGRAVGEMRLRYKMRAAEEAERTKGEKVGFAPKSMALPHKLSDCKTKDHSLAELFIVEGDSAAGPAIKGRNANTQAVLPIRGKGLNIEKALSTRGGADRIAGNAEVQGMIAALGAGSQDHFDVKQIRYGKIIILTDADDDGRHIELLLMTMFYRLMPELVRSGMLYVARPPLYSLIYKNKKVYISSEEELTAFRTKNPGYKDFPLRFKGLGEMNYDQLAETAIDPSTRSLAQIVIDDDSIADLTIRSLMGKDSNAKWDVLSKVILDEAVA